MTSSPKIVGLHCSPPSSKPKGFSAQKCTPGKASQLWQLSKGVVPGDSLPTIFKSGAGPNVSALLGSGPSVSLYLLAHVVQGPGEVFLLLAAGSYTRFTGALVPRWVELAWLEGQRATTASLLAGCPTNDVAG